MADTENFRISRGTWLASSVITLLVGGGGVVAYVMAQQMPAHGRTESYLGAKSCAACHPQQAKSWAQTRMAQAFGVLKPGARAAEKKRAGLAPQADYTRDPTCLGCHTTGYGRVVGLVLFIFMIYIAIYLGYLTIIKSKLF